MISVVTLPPAAPIVRTPSFEWEVGSCHDKTVDREGDVGKSLPGAREEIESFICHEGWPFSYSTLGFMILYTDLLVLSKKGDDQTE